LTKRRKEADGFFHNSALLKVVRLTMETNLLTSKYILDFGEATPLMQVLASVGIISLLVIVIFPVSGQQIAMNSVVDNDLNKARELVHVPVRIFSFIAPH
jgi:hypothetical protein